MNIESLFKTWRLSVVMTKAMWASKSTQFMGRKETGSIVPYNCPIRCPLTTIHEGEGLTLASSA